MTKFHLEIIKIITNFARAMWQQLIHYNAKNKYIDDGLDAVLRMPCGGHHHPL
jgi:hypothetical protein